MDYSSFFAKLSTSFFSGKKNLRKFSVSYLFLILVCVFSSCEVGLGSAVDTQPPEITIELNRTPYRSQFLDYEPR